MSTNNSNLSFWLNLMAIGIVGLAVLIFIYEMTQVPWAARVHKLDRSDVVYVKCEYGTDVYVTYNAERAVREDKTIHMQSSGGVVMLQDPREQCIIVD